jgi:hypothetical protein
MFDVCQAKGFQDIEWSVYFYMYVQVDLWPTNQYRSSTRHDVQCIKFEVCQAKGSQDIEWSVYSYVQFDPWPFDLKINNGQLLFMIRDILLNPCQ